MEAHIFESKFSEDDKKCAVDVLILIQDHRHSHAMTHDWRNYKNNIYFDSVIHSKLFLRIVQIHSSKDH